MSELSKSILQQHLGDAFTLHVYPEVDSTNTLARKEALLGAPEGTIILADCQTQGRGRMGREFFSPDGTGIYMSIILRPDETTQPLYITTAAAVAVAQAIEAVAGVPASIKWVNDVYCRQKKVCGILTEGVYDPTLQFAVLGIGINALQPLDNFPKDIQGRAGAVFDSKKPLPTHPREELAAAVITHFWAYYKELSSKWFLSEYRKRDMLCGRTVQVLDLNGTVLENVTVQGVDDEFALLVKSADGKLKTLSSGEVSLRL